MVTALKRTTGLINQQVYDLYGNDPAEDELTGNWIPLLKPLFDRDIRLDLFTTNYDLVIENALQIIGGDDFLYSYLGAPGRIQRYIDLKQWQEDTDRAQGLLTKLHGSLNWKQRRDQIAIGDILFTGDHSRHAIIYPGFKGSSNAIFFTPFHDYFSRMLAQADHVLIIGFAFRDEAINSALRTSIPAGATITVMDPNDKLRFPGRRKVQRLTQGFDARTVASFLSAVSASST